MHRNTNIRGGEMDVGIALALRKILGVELFLAGKGLCINGGEHIRGVWPSHLFLDFSFSK